MRTVGVVACISTAIVTGWEIPASVKDMSNDEVCQAAVGFQPSKTNTYCRELCNTYLQENTDANATQWLNSDLKVLEACYFQHYYTAPTDEDKASKGIKAYADLCFDPISTYRVDNLQYLNSLGETATPALCQSKCQELSETECLRFVWYLDTKMCYAFNKHQGLAFIHNRSDVVDKPEIGDDLCPNTGDCPEQKCFMFFQGTFARFEGKLLSGWRWCHPTQTPCEVTKAPKVNRFVQPIKCYEEEPNKNESTNAEEEEPNKNESANAEEEEPNKNESANAEEAAVEAE